jgi:hypothetical protein
MGMRNANKLGKENLDIVKNQAALQKAQVERDNRKEDERQEALNNLTW